MPTILAAFDDRHAAQLALHELARHGIARDDIHIEHDLERLKKVERARKEGSEPFLKALGEVFADLVRNTVNHHQLDVITEAMERGATVLVARTPDPGLAERAAVLVREAGAFNVGVQGAAAQPH